VTFTSISLLSQEKEHESFKVKRSNLRANLVIGENGVISNARSGDWRQHPDGPTYPKFSSTSSPLRSTITTSSSTNNQDRPVYSKEYLSELKATTPSGSRLPQTPYDEKDLPIEGLEDTSVVIGRTSGPMMQSNTDIRGRCGSRHTHSDTTFHRCGTSKTHTKASGPRITTSRRICLLGCFNPRCWTRT
jgi:hypothetical protein